LYLRLNVLSDRRDRRDKRGRCRGWLWLGALDSTAGYRRFGRDYLLNGGWRWACHTFGFFAKPLPYQRNNPPNRLGLLYVRAKYLRRGVRQLTKFRLGHEGNLQLLSNWNL